MAEININNEDISLKRWRLILGGNEADGIGYNLSGIDKGMDQVLEALYDTDRSGGLGSSCPNVNRWLGDIRSYFPKSVVQIMQKDALEKLNLQKMLLEPEMLSSVEPDIHLVATLISLSHVIPQKTKETARQVVRKVVEEIEKKLRNPLIQAVKGSLSRSIKTRRPKPNEINWDKTIKANLKNYLYQQKAIIPEQLIGHGRKRSSLRDIVLCIDQSGSMATSVIYSAIFGAVLTSISAVRTQMIVFDTSVVDLTENLQDPVELLFGTQLGGGTDIARALAYCQEIISSPSKTIFVLITDLFEGGDVKKMLQHTSNLVSSGVNMICLLALSDKGAPCFDERNAAALAGLGVPSFACTPDKFPDLMAAAINKQDIGLWASRNEIVTA
ncbi:MAG: VWA domain-containing protein [Desulfobacterales bacterium]|nr:VWA domain-containing protein [Desulfobacterales bacterium]